MSIINQTLRELDARKTDSAPDGIALHPVAVTRNQPTGWRGAVAGVFALLVAGVLLWFMFRPADHTTIRMPAASLPSVKPVPAVPAPGALPAPPPGEVSELSPDLAEPEVLADAAPITPSDTQAREAPAPGGLEVSQDLSLKMKFTGTIRPPETIRIAVNPPSAEDEANERFRKAITWVRQGRESQARLLLEEALRLDPAHLPARQTLATLLSEAGQNREAEAVLREGLAIAPDNTWFPLSLARLQASRGDTEGAVATLQGRVEGPGVNAEYRATLAALLMRLKQHQEAARQYGLALEQQSGQATWWTGLGLALEAQGKIDEARSAYRRALTTGNLPEGLQAFVRAKIGD